MSGRVQSPLHAAEHLPLSHGQSLGINIVITYPTVMTNSVYITLALSDPMPTVQNIYQKNNHRANMKKKPRPNTLAPPLPFVNT